MATPQTRVFSLSEIVRKLEGDTYEYERLHPVVYNFSNGVTKRDSGPHSGIYAGTSSS